MSEPTRADYWEAEQAFASIFSRPGTAEHFERLAENFISEEVAQQNPYRAYRELMNSQANDGGRSANAE